MTVARPKRHRESWLQLCEIEEEYDESGNKFTYFGLADYPEIEAQDDDILHTVEKGDRIDKLAHKYYGTVRLWWVIACANEWDEPLTAMIEGDEITIPSPTYVRGKLLP